MLAPLGGIAVRGGIAALASGVASRFRIGGINTTAKIHGNSRQYVGDTHVYGIKNLTTGQYHKAGESMQGLNKHGQSIRAEAQKRQLEKSTGQQFKTKVHRTFDTKSAARDYETALIIRYRRIFGKDTLPGNKGNR